jgi:hypothetical protein
VHGSPFALARKCGWRPERSKGDRSESTCVMSEDANSVTEQMLSTGEGRDQ